MQHESTSHDSMVHGNTTSANTMHANISHNEPQHNGTEHFDTPGGAEPTLSPLEEDPMSEVINTNELLSMILSHLHIRDLTRALSVSKRWQQTILGSPELRRTLFLQPTLIPSEHLCWKQGRLEWYAVVSPTPSQHSQVIVETHPILKQETRVRTLVDCRQACNTFSMAPPATLLSQPPFKEVALQCHGLKTTLRSKEGVTFGDVINEVQDYLCNQHDRATFDRDYCLKLHSIAHLDDLSDKDFGDEDSFSNGHTSDKDFARYTEFIRDEHPTHQVTIDVKGFVAASSEPVQKAREATKCT